MNFDIPGNRSRTGRMIWEPFLSRETFPHIARSTFPDHEVPGHQRGQLSPTTTGPGPPEPVSQGAGFLVRRRRSWAKPINPARSTAAMTMPVTTFALSGVLV